MPEPALCYIQHQEGGYLTRNKSHQWCRVSSREQALSFTQEKAETVLKSNIGAKERAFWRIIPAENLAASDTPKKTAIIPAPPQKKTHVQAGTGNTPDITAIISNQTAALQELAGYLAGLSEQHSRIDMEISDLLHYIEFNALDASKGYQAYRMLKDALQRRRKIKDDIYKAQLIATSTKDDLFSGELLRKVTNADAPREYAPRILTHLFPKAE